MEKTVWAVHVIYTAVDGDSGAYFRLLSTEEKARSLFEEKVLDCEYGFKSMFKDRYELVRYSKSHALIHTPYSPAKTRIYVSPVEIDEYE